MFNNLKGSNNRILLQECGLIEEGFGNIVKGFGRGLGSGLAKTGMTAAMPVTIPLQLTSNLLDKSKYTKPIGDGIDKTMGTLITPINRLNEYATDGKYRNNAERENNVKRELGQNAKYAYNVGRFVVPTAVAGYGAKKLYDAYDHYNQGPIDDASEAVADTYNNIVN